MLVSVFTGENIKESKFAGEYHFSNFPNVGENVDLNGALFSVVNAWHKPDIHYAGAKCAVLLQSERQSRAKPVDVQVLESA